MTLDRLNEHDGLLDDLATTRAIRDSLMAKAPPGAAGLNGMPHSAGVSDKVRDLAVEIADLDTQVETLEWLVRKSEKRIRPFIAGIRDNQIRMIFRLRFIRGMSWTDVAAALGGKNTKQAVKMICYRYLKSCDPM